MIAATIFVAQPATADLRVGESQRYLGPLNGIDACGVPDPEPLPYGGACFDVAETGVKYDIRVQDDSGGRAFAMYRVLNEKGTVLSSERFCESTTTRPVHATADRISVSVYVDPHEEHCDGGRLTGLGGSIHVKVRPPEAV